MSSVEGRPERALSSRLKSPSRNLANQYLAVECETASDAIQALMLRQASKKFKFIVIGPNKNML